MAGKGQKRKDKDRIVLKAGEAQRPNGTYYYRWTGKDGKRHAVYAKTLEELREKEAQIANDQFIGIKADARNVTINEMFDLWCQIKRGLKNNTFENYKYMYNLFARPNFGKSRISTLKKSDVKRFYIQLADDRGLQASTIDSVHTVLHQVLQMAVDDRYISNNPSDGVLKEGTKKVPCVQDREAQGTDKTGTGTAAELFEVPSCLWTLVSDLRRDDWNLPADR